MSIRPLLFRAGMRGCGLSLSIAALTAPQHTLAGQQASAPAVGAIHALAKGFAAHDTATVGRLLDDRFHIGPLTGAAARATLMRAMGGSAAIVSSIDVDSVSRIDSGTIVYTTVMTASGRHAAPFVFSSDGRIVEMGIFRVSAADASTVTAADTATRNRLLRVGEWDQRYRARIVELSKPTPAGANAGRSPTLDSLRRLQLALDSAGLDTLRAIVHESGWPSVSRVGPDAAVVAFLIVQHAPPAVQEEYLPVLERAVAAGDARPADLALLTDRVLMFQGKKQRYGSQVRGAVGGKLEVWPIDDEAHVDDRRRAIGLEPLADYLKRFGIDWKPGSPNG